MLGRFISPDSVIPNLVNPQALNRYAYVYNNPLKYTDPSGNIPVLVIVGGIALLKAIDYGWSAYDAYQSGLVLTDPNASASDKAAASANLALIAAAEAAEPDDILPIGLPLDDIARIGIVGAVRQAPRSGEELAKLADNALRSLPTSPNDLRKATVGAAEDAQGNITYSVYHRTAEGTEEAVKHLRNQGLTVLDAPSRRSATYHAERQLAANGFTNIGISRKDMCPRCESWFGRRPEYTVTPFRRQ